MKFLDKETGTVGERIRTLFKEQGIMIVSILTTDCMAIGDLIEALLGGPRTSTSTSQSTTTNDKKGGAVLTQIMNLTQVVNIHHLG